MQSFSHGQKDGQTPSRFLDLLPERKEIVYDIVLEKSEESELYEQGIFQYQWPLLPRSNRVVALRKTEVRPCRTGIPFLLHVNLKVRSEAGKVGFGSRRFELFIDARYSDCALEDVKVWLKTIVGDFATHVRDVRVRAGSEARNEISFGAVIQACFHQIRGLQITGLDDDSWDVDDQDAQPSEESFFDMPSYVATLEKNRIGRGQRGEVIADFFVADWDALCRALLGPCQKMLDREGEDEWLYCGCGHAYGLFNGLHPDIMVR